MQFDSREKQRDVLNVHSIKKRNTATKSEVCSLLVSTRKRELSALYSKQLSSSVMFFCIMTLYYDRPKDDTVCKLARVRNVNECL